MLSATSHIGLEFLTKFLNMSKLQNWLILLYQSRYTLFVAIQLFINENKNVNVAFVYMKNYERTHEFNTSIVVGEVLNSYRRNIMTS